MTCLSQVVDQLCDGLGKTPKAVAEQVGIETDEAAKVSIKDFVLPPPPRK